MVALCFFLMCMVDSVCTQSLHLCVMLMTEGHILFFPVFACYFQKLSVANSRAECRRDVDVDRSINQVDDGRHNRSICV